MRKDCMRLTLTCGMLEMEKRYACSGDAARALVR
jgi:hypothetical protein